jgi:tryptophan synthase beta chain
VGEGLTKRILLPERDLPERWYNILADLPVELPPYLRPDTLQPLRRQDWDELLPPEIVEQEFTKERWIEIPEQVRDVYKMWRPSPLCRAERLERALDTPARIYFKFEGLSPSGSHKPNTAVSQVYYNAQHGVRRLTTETGAGQWGSALAFAGALFGVKVGVYMVRVSCDQKPMRRALMQTWGADVYPSPSERTAAGRDILKRDPESPGSVGIAISEAVEDALGREDTRFAQGSTMNHVVLHHTVIGLEAKKQLELAGDYPDAVIGAVGGGSNFAGLAFPFVADRLTGSQARTRFIAAESSACPTLTQGVYAYDYPDVAGLGAVLPMRTAGHGFVPPTIHAGGLRFHGSAPTLCLLQELGLIEARAVNQLEVFEEAVRFARHEGFLIAPESAHALRVAVIEALAAREAGEPRTILFNLSGHGHFDLSAYDAYLAGQLADCAVPEAELARALEGLPEVALPAPQAAPAEMQA